MLGCTAFCLVTIAGMVFGTLAYVVYRKLYRW